MLAACLKLVRQLLGHPAWASMLAAHRWKLVEFAFEPLLHDNLDVRLAGAHVLADVLHAKDLDRKRILASAAADATSVKVFRRLLEGTSSENDVVGGSSGDSQLMFLADEAAATGSDARKLGRASEAGLLATAEAVERMRRAALDGGGSPSVSRFLGLSESAPANLDAVGAGVSEGTGDMELTPSTRANLDAVLDAVENPVPLLLEGPTGVGKSSTVKLAASMKSPLPLIRFNMSARVAVDDFFGKVVLKAVDGGGEVPMFQEQPFTVAFSRGHWLLVDEGNLAKDDVLQPMEAALDSGVLLVRNPASSVESYLEYKMHPNFRLFFTQNPATGEFKGKREVLSQSFLSRFVPLAINCTLHVLSRPRRSCSEGSSSSASAGV